MFQKKGSTGHVCVKAVQLQDEATAKVYSLFFCFLLSYEFVVLVETPNVWKIVTFSFLETVYYIFLLKNEFDRENNEIKQFKVFEGVCKNK